MTPNNRKFADEYLICGNAARAYRAAYGDKSATVASANGSRLLRKACVRAYIDERMAVQDAARVADADEVLAYLTKVLRRKTRSEVVVVEAQGDGVSKARQLRKAPDERDRLKAAELLGKFRRLFTDAAASEPGGPLVVIEAAPDCVPVLEELRKRKQQAAADSAVVEGARECME